MFDLNSIQCLAKMICSVATWQLQYIFTEMIFENVDASNLS